MGISFGASDARAQDADAGTVPEPHWRKAAIAASLSAGAYRSDLGKLDGELDAQGYATLSTVTVHYGLTIDVTYHRLVVEMGVDGLGERTATGSGEPIDASLLHGWLTAGYHVWQTTYSALYPSIGPAFSSLMLEFDPDNPPFAPNELSMLRAERADRMTMGLDLGITLEQILPFVSVSDDRTAALAPFLSFRVGYIWQLVDGDYDLMLEGDGTEKFDGGPRDNLGGIYCRLSIGDIVGLDESARR